MKQVAGKIKATWRNTVNWPPLLNLVRIWTRAPRGHLDRGQRIVELFKQNAVSADVQLQAAVLWAMQRGYLDPIPVERVKEFQLKLQEFSTTRKEQVLNKILAKKQIDEESRKGSHGCSRRVQGPLQSNSPWPAFETSARRIKSIKNTAQITKAMQMVAASKMRKAQEAALNGRPYAILLNRVLVSLRNRLDEAPSRCWKKGRSRANSSFF